jgi:hypothetical protein
MAHAIFFLMLSLPSAAFPAAPPNSPAGRQIEPSSKKPDPGEIESGARGGDAEAQYQLGILYERGLGVPRDFASAQRWYREAAGQGHMPALVALETLMTRLAAQKGGSKNNASPGRPVFSISSERLRLTISGAAWLGFEATLDPGLADPRAAVGTLQAQARFLDKGKAVSDLGNTDPIGENELQPGDAVAREVLFPKTVRVPSLEKCEFVFFFLPDSPEFEKVELKRACWTRKGFAPGKCRF